MVFAISFAHVFGFSAAVTNFNRLPELLTAVARRIGGVPTWHFFGDQGTLEFQKSSSPEEQTSGAQEWVGELFSLCGAPSRRESIFKRAQSKLTWAWWTTCATSAGGASPSSPDHRRFPSSC